jgi:hypothetical protein
MRFHQVRKPQQNFPALRRAHGAPRAFEGASRRRDRPVDVDFVAFRDGGDDLLGGRIEGLKVRPERTDVLAVDQQQPGLCGREPGPASRE